VGKPPAEWLLKGFSVLGRLLQSQTHLVLVERQPLVHAGDDVILHWHRELLLWSPQHPGRAWKSPRLRRAYRYCTDHSASDCKCMSEACISSAAGPAHTAAAPAVNET